MLRNDRRRGSFRMAAATLAMGDQARVIPSARQFWNSITCPCLTFHCTQADQALDQSPRRDTISNPILESRADHPVYQRGTQSRTHSPRQFDVLKSLFSLSLLRSGYFKSGCLAIQRVSLLKGVFYEVFCDQAISKAAACPHSEPCFQRPLVKYLIGVWRHYQRRVAYSFRFQMNCWVSAQD